jgi:hypothetical protein
MENVKGQVNEQKATEILSRFQAERAKAWTAAEGIATDYFKSVDGLVKRAGKCIADLVTEANYSPKDAAQAVRGAFPKANTPAEKAYYSTTVANAKKEAARLLTPEGATQAQADAIRDAFRDRAKGGGRKAAADVAQDPAKVDLSEIVARYRATFEKMTREQRDAVRALLAEMDKATA